MAFSIFWNVIEFKAGLFYFDQNIHHHMVAYGHYTLHTQINNEVFFFLKWQARATQTMSYPCCVGNVARQR